MRIMVIILSSFAGQVFVFHSGIHFRLNEVIWSRSGSPEAVVWVSFFGAWTLATALVYAAPSIAGWLFTSAGVLGIVVGASSNDRLLIVWGAVATVLAGLTILAQREKRRADQRDRHRAQQDLAVFVALCSLQETVPELLTRVLDADGDASDPVRSDPLARVLRDVSPQDQVAAGWPERSRC